MNTHTMIAPLDLGDRPRILVIALRRLGDVLLTTPLIRSIRRAWPNAQIDALVFADTAGILAGNPDIDNVVTMPSLPAFAQSVALGAKLWRRYDLAISTQSGDRPTGFAIAAGRISMAPVEDRLGGRLKGLLLDRSVAASRPLHRVEEMLRLVDALGIARVPEVVGPRGRLPDMVPPGNYAVIHAAPMFTYKRWTVAGWRALAEALKARGLAVVATGGPAPGEGAYLDQVWQGMDLQRAEGRLGWPELADLLTHAAVYIGPDTSVTHLAAASGCATVALYGPTDPRLWGPWPVGGLEEPWAASDRRQRRGNVWLVQHPFPCTPCQLEGCERKLESHSACLDSLATAEVLGAVEEALGAS